MITPPPPTLRPRTTRQFGLDPGQSVGGYRVVAELGGGGMGVVYVGEHLLLGRRAAIKVLRPEHSHQQELVERFFAEARATTTIRHPGIVEVYDFGYTDEGLAFLVMELLEGVSLARRLARGQRFPLAVALPIARRIAMALSAAHERGIIHRDVKPDNIFLVRDGDGGPIAQVKLLDFGIARLIEDGALAARRTNTGVVMGTPTYMSPEQCRGASECDQRSDLYSFGCVFFEMLGGRPPFGGDSVGDLLVAHLTVPPPDIRGYALDTPEDVATIIERLLAKEPGQRFESARAFIAALDVAIDRLGLDRRSSAMATVAAPPLPGAGFVAMGTPAPSTSTLPPRPRAVARAAAAVAGVVLVMAGLVMAGSRLAAGPHPAAAGPTDAAVTRSLDAAAVVDAGVVDAMPTDAATPVDAAMPRDAAPPVDARRGRHPRDTDVSTDPGKPIPPIDINTPVP